MFRDLEYAVLDVETTGFSPANRDRIIEIGIVRVDSSNHVISEYGTLINPKRDVGPTHIHGITARDVLGAPTFDEIAGDVLAAIKGAVIVAHNAAFDLRFLLHECAACGAPIPPNASLCTMRLSRRVWPDLACRKLSALCAEAGIDLSNAHSAIDDARATAALLAVCLDGLRRSPVRIRLEDLGVDGCLACEAEWPLIAPSGKQCRRDDAQRNRKRAGGRLTRLFERLPAHNDTNLATDAYLEVLERALEDRQISEEEIEALQEMARTLDMDQEEVQSAHRTLLRDLIRTALMDNVITEAEKRDIENVADLLGIPPHEYVATVEELRSRPHDNAPGVSRTGACVRGQSVCFTGQFNSIIDGSRVTRETMERLAAEKGMVVEKNVTKKLDYLVCADPNSLSSKARKAREYGTRILAEPAFLKMLGE